MSIELGTPRRPIRQIGGPELGTVNWKNGAWQFEPHDGAPAWCREAAGTPFDSQADLVEELKELYLEALGREEVPHPPHPLDR